MFPETCVHLGVEAGVLNSDAYYIREVMGQVDLQMYPLGDCTYSGQIDGIFPSKDHTLLTVNLSLQQDKVYLLLPDLLCV